MSSPARILLALFIICLASLACSQSSPTAVNPAQQQAASAIPSDTPEPTAVPVNASVISDLVNIQPANAALLQPLADLWATRTIVSDIAFLPGTNNILLGTGTSYTTAGMSQNGFLGVHGNARVILWNTITNTPQDLFTTEDNDDLLYNSLAISPDGSRIAFATYGRIVLATVNSTGSNDQPTYATQILPMERISQANPDAGLTFNSDGTLLAVVNNVGDVQVWDAASGAILNTFMSESTNHPQWGKIPECVTIGSGVAFMPDGKTVLSSCNNTIKINDLSSGSRTEVLLPRDVMQVFALSPDGKQVATGGWGGIFNVWDFPSAEGIFEFEGHSQKITSIQYSPDGNLVAYASEDGSVDLWDAHTWKRLTTLEIRADLLAFSPDGHFLVTSTYAKGAKLWGVSSSSSITAMDGARVLLSEGPIQLSAWQNLIPSSWLTPAGSLPRYEIHITSSQAAVENCSYNGDGATNLMVNRVRIDVSVEVLDMQTGDSIARTTYKGGEPRECPETYSFGANQFVEYIYGAEPESGSFADWLAEVMLPLGFQE